MEIIEETAVAPPCMEWDQCVWLAPQNTCQGGLNEEWSTVETPWPGSAEILAEEGIQQYFLAGKSQSS